MKRLLILRTLVLPLFVLSACMSPVQNMEPAQDSTPTQVASDGVTAFTSETRRCPVQLAITEIEGQTYHCGVVYVPENYDEPNGRVIELTYMVLHSTSQTPEPDPVVYLSGGPGGSALTEMSEEGTNVRASFDKIRERRDIITYDQRGDRFSSMLYCSPFVQLFNDDLPSEITQNENFASMMQEFSALDQQNQESIVYGICGKGLETLGVDITQYNSATSVKDIQQVVKLAGYSGQYNLYGISYGTRLSLTAMRDTPESVRSVVLDSTYPPEIQNYETYPTLYEEPFQQVFAMCVADPACNESYPNIEARFVDLLARIGQTPITVDPPLQVAGTLLGTYLVQSDTLTEITPDFFVNLADLSNRSPGGGYMPYVPALVHYLEAGDVETVVALINGTLHSPATAVAPIQSPELQRLQEAQAAQAAAASEIAAATQAQIDAALAQRLSIQWLQAVVKDLSAQNEAGVNQQLTALEFIWLPLQPPITETLETFAKDALTDEAAAAANALAAQMTREDVRETLELVRTVGSETVGFDAQLSRGQNYAVECYEEVPFQNEERAQAILAAQPYPYLFNPESQVPGRQGLCAVFEETGVVAPAIENERVVSDIPTLVYQGLIDTQTPASWGPSAVEGLSNGFLVKVANSGHGIMPKTACAQSLSAHFFDHPATLPSTSCIATTLQFPTVALIESLR